MINFALIPASKRADNILLKSSKAVAIDKKLTFYFTRRTKPRFPTVGTNAKKSSSIEWKERKL